MSSNSEISLIRYIQKNVSLMKNNNIILLLSLVQYGLLIHVISLDDLESFP